jgi:hypothetical protein
VSCNPRFCPRCADINPFLDLLFLHDGGDNQSGVAEVEGDCGGHLALDLRGWRSPSIYGGPRRSISLVVLSQSGINRDQQKVRETPTNSGDQVWGLPRQNGYKWKMKLL